MVWRLFGTPDHWLFNFSGSDVKESPAMQETRVWSLGQEDPLQKEMATHSSILAWKILWTEGAWQATVCGVAESDTTEWLLPFLLFLAVLGLHSCVGFFSSTSRQGLFSSGAQAYCDGFSCGAQAPGCRGFGSCGTWALEHRLNSCGAEA